MGSSVRKATGWPAVAVRSFLLLSLLIAPRAGSAQETPAPPEQKRLDDVFQAGLIAFEAGSYRQAAEAWASLVEVAPAYVAASGSAAYWLGQAYRALDQSGRALDAWHHGLEALDDAGVDDLRLADAFVEAAFAAQEKNRYGTAAAAYLQLLGAADGPLPTEAQPLLHRHLAPLAPVLPASIRQAALEEGPEGVWRLRPGGGALLVRWWRGQDPLPATPEGERLIEHLERVAFARAHYAGANDQGLDARGDLYVRLGAPSHRVSFRPMRFAPHEFPENELWAYRHVSSEAVYLFVRFPGEDYRPGTMRDLIPASMRTGIGNAGRGANRAVAVLELLRDAFAHFSTLHVTYAEHYADVANYLDALAFQAGAQMGWLVDGPPGTFTHTLLETIRNEEVTAALRRARAVPRSYSRVLEPYETLPVSVRWARFLDPDGTTRTEIYWGLPAAGMALSPERVERLVKAGHASAGHYLLTFTVARQAPDYRTHRLDVKHHLVDARAARDERWPVQTALVRGDTGTYHLALQWDQRWAGVHDEEGRRVTPGALLKLQSMRIDSLQALRGDGAVLEMSDLKPVWAGSLPEAAAEPSLAAGGDPYPYPAITPGDSLILVFEIYHLRPAADGRVHYSVSYDVARRSEQGWLRMPGRDRRGGQTSTRTVGTGRNRTQQEYIFMDLAQWRGEGELQITVTARDETSGQQVVRTLRFDLTSSR